MLRLPFLAQIKKVGERRKNDEISHFTDFFQHSAVTNELIQTPVDPASFDRHVFDSSLSPIANRHP